MLLAIDVGNTNTVFAVFKERKLLGEWRITTDARRTSDEYALAMTQLMALHEITAKHINAAIISTVVPQNLFALRKLCRDYFSCVPLVVGDPDVNIGMEIKVDRPSDVGADRLVNAVAAYEKFGSSTVVLDFGTATTFDVVNAEGHYAGGIIAPGINLALDSLHKASAKLPEVAVQRPAKVIGTSTVSAMQSGIYWGYVSLIEGIVDRVVKEYGQPMTVIATGGLASLFIKATDTIQHLERDLTIEGLELIYQRNI